MFSPCSHCSQPSSLTMSLPLICENWREAEGLARVTVSFTGLFPHRDRNCSVSVHPGDSTTGYSPTIRRSCPVPHPSLYLTPSLQDPVLGQTLS